MTVLTPDLAWILILSQTSFHRCGSRFSAACARRCILSRPHSSLDSRFLRSHLTSISAWSYSRASPVLRWNPFMPTRFSWSGPSARVSFSPARLIIRVPASSVTDRSVSGCQLGGFSIWCHVLQLKVGIIFDPPVERLSLHKEKPLGSVAILSLFTPGLKLVCIEH
jgi:hypothetical protein